MLDKDILEEHAIDRNLKSEQDNFDKINSKEEEDAMMTPYASSTPHNAHTAGSYDSDNIQTPMLSEWGANATLTPNYETSAYNNPSAMSPNASASYIHTPGYNPNRSPVYNQSPLYSPNQNSNLHSSSPNYSPTHHYRSPNYSPASNMQSPQIRSTPGQPSMMGQMNPMHPIAMSPSLNEYSHSSPRYAPTTMQAQTPSYNSPTTPNYNLGLYSAHRQSMVKNEVKKEESSNADDSRDYD